MVVCLQKKTFIPGLRLCLIGSVFSSCLFGAPAQAQLSILGALDTRPSVAPQPAQNIETPSFTQPRVIPEATAPRPMSPSLHPLARPPAVSGPIRQNTRPAASQPPSFVPDQTGPLAAPAPSQPEGTRTLFSADEIGFDRDIGVMTARGNVEISYEGRVLIADTVSYNQNEDMVTASGNVQILEPNGDVVFSEYLEITSDLKTGVAQKLRLSLADRSLIEANKGRRKAGRFTIAEDGTYSPCQKCEDDPSRPLTWKMTASEIQHDSDQRRIEYSDVFLEFYDIPVLYTPYFAHPDPTQLRETGFLVPSYGSIGTIGSFVDIPYYIVVNDQSDVTLRPRYFFDESQGLLEAEYRNKTRKGEYILAGSGTFVDGGDGATSPNEEEFRGHLDSHGQFNIDHTWRWGFDVNAASDETYIRRYNIEDNTENSHLISDLYMEGFRQRNYARADLHVYQVQRNIDDDELQNGKVEFRHSHMGEPGAGGGYFVNDSSLYAINRRDNMQVGRLAFDGGYIIPHTSASGDIYELSTKLILSGYYVNNFAVPGFTDEQEGFEAEAVPSMGFSWRRPLTRSHMSGKANEILEPVVHLSLAPNVGENEQIPNEDSQDFEFDDTNLFARHRNTGLDRIDGGQRIDYGLNWGIYGENGGYTQLFVGQSYRFQDDDTYDTNSGLEDNLSDIVGRIDTTPSNMIDFLYRYRLDKNDLSLNRSEANIFLGPKSSRLQLSHFYLEDTGIDSEFEDREEIFGKLENQISKYLRSSFDARYRLSEPEGSVAFGGRVTYQDECVTLYADFRREFFDDRDIEPDASFAIYLELKNLGGVSAF